MKTKHPTHHLLFLVAAAVAAALIAPVGAGQAPGGPQGPRIELFRGHRVAAGRVIVKFRGASPAEQISRETDADRDEEIGGAGARLLHSRSLDTSVLIEILSRRPDVEYVEPDFVVQADQELPPDAMFGYLWGLWNTGQTIGGVAGFAGADVRAPLAWSISTGSRANVAAVVDTGIDYAHPDLAANVWSAPVPFTARIGQRSITCAQGTHGFNAIAWTCDPRDDNNHGTHTAGTIGAVGGNGVGVAGVSQVASLMAAKCLDAAGSGYVSDAVNAIEFVIQARALLGSGANVRVLSNSWVGGAPSQALLDEINRANSYGMLFVAAAGNSGSNNDVVPAYPASYTAPNVISVAATDNRDRLASFSNFGPATVHLGAPGVNVLSTVRGGGYAWASGTSMAAPHVSGAALLALSACNLTTSGVKSVLLDTVDQVLAGWTATGGRLNAEAALRACTAGAPLDFSLAAVPASVTVKRGGTAVYSVSIASQGGFANQVSFSVSGLPRNATASFSPASVVAPGSTTLTVVTSSTRGTFGLTITGTSGGLVHATQVGLTVVK